MNNQLQDEKKDTDVVGVGTLGQTLSEIFLKLEDYQPTIPDAVTAYYLRTSGLEPKDPRILRLIAIAAQKLITDIANSALQYHELRTASSQSEGSKAAEDEKLCLTMEDLTPALAELGIVPYKPHHHV